MSLCISMYRIAYMTWHHQYAQNLLFCHADFGFCDYNITQSDSGSYTWEEMEGNMEVSQTCALEDAAGDSVQDAVARRMCNVFGEWEDPNIENCVSIVSHQFQDLNTVSTTIMTVIITAHTYTYR